MRRGALAVSRLSNCKNAGKIRCLKRSGGGNGGADIPCRREAQRIAVGKTGHAPSCAQLEITAVMVDLARKGQRVVRLKGGDPMIFGRATEELGAARAAGIAVEVVPGINAVQAAAAALQTSLTERTLARRLQFVTGHDANGALPLDHDWSAMADLSRTAERLTDSTFQMVRNIPNLALIPLVILWFGIDEGAKLFLTSFGVFFPIYIKTLHGVRTVDQQLIEMARSYGIGPWNLFRKVILPGALPSIFVGMRYALGIMWLTLIVSETIAATSGVGYLAMHAREFMLVDVVVLAIVIKDTPHRSKILIRT
jgi:sulfonate transport system permease protein